MINGEAEGADGRVIQNSHKEYEGPPSGGLFSTGSRVAPVAVLKGETGTTGATEATFAQRLDRPMRKHRNGRGRSYPSWVSDLGLMSG